MVKNLKLVGVTTVNGEEHYVVQSWKADENMENAMDFDEVKLKGNMKKEASKPLLLLRGE